MIGVGLLVGSFVWFGAVRFGWFQLDGWWDGGLVGGWVGGWVGWLVGWLGG